MDVILLFITCIIFSGIVEIIIKKKKRERREKDFINKTSSIRNRYFKEKKSKDISIGKDDG